MGRRKYAVNVKPNPNLIGSYVIRFTDEIALQKFTDICVNAGILVPGIRSYYLNEWKPITAKQFNIILFSTAPELNNSNMIFSCNEHFEHGLKEAV